MQQATQSERGAPSNQHPETTRCNPLKQRNTLKTTPGRGRNLNANPTAERVPPLSHSAAPKLGGAAVLNQVFKRGWVNEGLEARGACWSTRLRVCKR